MRNAFHRAGVSALALVASLTVFLHQAGATPTVGQPVPALTVAELDGTPFNLSDFRGHVVIVNMWATWCAPCRLEMPELDAFYRQYRDRGVVMIGLSADRPRDRNDVAKVMRAFVYPAAMLNDAHPNGFGTPRVLPMTYVVDADGIVRAQLKPAETPITAKGLGELVLPLLPEKVDPHSAK